MITKWRPFWNTIEDFLIFPKRQENAGIKIKERNQNHLKTIMEQQYVIKTTVFRLKKVIFFSSKRRHLRIFRKQNWR